MLHFYHLKSHHLVFFVRFVGKKAAKRCTWKLLNAWAWFALIFNFAAAHSPACSVGESKSWKLLLFYTHTSCVTHFERLLPPQLFANTHRVHKYAWTQAERHLVAPLSLSAGAFRKTRTLRMFYLRAPRERTNCAVLLGKTSIVGWVARGALCENRALHADTFMWRQNYLSL